MKNARMLESMLLS